MFSEVKDYFILHGQSADFYLDYCASCGIGFSAPFLDEEGLSCYYPDNYEAYVPKQSLIALLQRWKYASDLRVISKHATGKSMFEIGCGRAEFLMQAKKHGYETSGLEPSAAGRTYAAQKFHLSIAPDSAVDFRFTRQFDVIVMRHVLEHLVDFRACLDNIVQNGLSPDGILFLKLPRMDSWEAKYFGKYWSGYDMPRHRVHFTMDGICRMLSEVGLSPVFCHNEIVPNDFLRSITNHARYDRQRIDVFARLFTALPHPIQFIASQFFCSIFGVVCNPGRMILIARKNSHE
jgi:SAM-dependent methyltransferase